MERGKDKNFWFVKSPDNLLLNVHVRNNYRLWLNLKAPSFTKKTVVVCNLTTAMVKRPSPSVDG